MQKTASLKKRGTPPAARNATNVDRRNREKCARIVDDVVFWASYAGGVLTTRIGWIEVFRIVRLDHTSSKHNVLNF